MKTRILGAVALGLMTAACGTTPQERVTGGAAAGAATGAGVGALGGPVGALAGAGIGAAAGAATGAATEPSTLNLGEPPWSNPEARVPGFDDNTGRSGRSRGGSGYAQGQQIREMQQALRQRGYEVGPIDGILGPQTQQAMTRFQRDNNLQVTNRPNQQTLAALNVSDSNMRTGSTARSDRDRAYMGGGMVGDGRTGGTATGAGSTTGGAAGGGSGIERPNPPTCRGGSVATPSNNPMNDPVGGTGQAIRPGFNQNRDSGSQGQGSGSGTSQ